MSVFCLIGCIFGLFGDNCDKECHCKDEKEDCQVMQGRCQYGCSGNYAGDTCQGNALCAPTVTLCMQ